VYEDKSTVYEEALKRSFNHLAARFGIYLGSECCAGTTGCYANVMAGDIEARRTAKQAESDVDGKFHVVSVESAMQNNEKTLVRSHLSIAQMLWLLSADPSLVCTNLVLENGAIRLSLDCERRFQVEFLRSPASHSGADSVRFADAPGTQRALSFD
jgi:hypothetical protein